MDVINLKSQALEEGKCQKKKKSPNTFSNFLKVDASPRQAPLGSVAVVASWGYFQGWLLLSSGGQGCPAPGGSSRKPTTTFPPAGAHPTPCFSVLPSSPNTKAAVCPALCQLLKCKDDQVAAPASGTSAQGRGLWRRQTQPGRSTSEWTRHLGDSRERTMTFVPDVEELVRGLSFLGRPDGGVPGGGVTRDPNIW